MNELAPTEPGGEFLLYQTEDGQVRLDVRLQDETVWLPQPLMAELFQTTQQNISQHIRNIYEERELTPEATHKKFLSVRREGKRDVRRELDFYNLDMIISVGYRVKSLIATRFRMWATQQLKEYLVKGFVMDDERLKNPPGKGSAVPDYFDELLARIRDIRSSEKVFWRKVLEIYALSIDYDPRPDYSREFFAVVQNKMHWAAHGHTAAEIIDRRADATKTNMGLTTWSGEKPRKTDVTVAKNYLSEKELDVLNRIVTMYLEFAELQALSRKPMHMRDWISKLDDFLKLSDREILTHAGTVSHEQALDKARQEYEKFHREHLNDPSPVEGHFLEAVKELKQLEESRDLQRSEQQP